MKSYILHYILFISLDYILQGSQVITTDYYSLSCLDWKQSEDDDMLYNKYIRSSWEDSGYRYFKKKTIFFHECFWVKHLITG